MKVRRVVTVVAVLAACGQAYGLDERARREEEVASTLRAHCEGLMQDRLAASREGRWREVFRTAKSYVDACRGADDKFASSKALEDMGMASMMMDDIRLGLYYVQQCLDTNTYAGGCYVRKTEMLLLMGKTREAEAAAWKGLSSTERAIAIAKQEIAAMKRPDPRAEQALRNKYLRKREELEGRISSLEEAQRQLADLNAQFD